MCPRNFPGTSELPLDKHLKKMKEGNVVGEYETFQNPDLNDFLRMTNGDVSALTKKTSLNTKDKIEVGV